MDECLGAYDLSKLNQNEITILEDLTAVRLKQ